jgi:hypothetical protein
MTGLPGMGLPESMAGSIMPNFIGSMGPSSNYGAQMLLRIHTANTVDSAHRSTVVTVYVPLISMAITVCMFSLNSQILRYIHARGS